MDLYGSARRWLLSLGMFVGLALGLFATPAVAGTLSLSKTVSTASVPSGTFFTYTINYACLTTSCAGMVLSDVLDADLSGAAADVTLGSSVHVASSTFTAGTRTAQWTFVSPLPGGSSGQVSMTVRFPPGTTPNGAVASNTANLTSSDSGSVNANAPNVTAAASNKFTIAKTLVGGGQVGQNTVYSIDICQPASGNVGGLNLSAITLTDTLPAGSVFVSAGNGGTHNGASPGSVTWAVPNQTVSANAGCWETFLTVNFPAGSNSAGQVKTNTASATGTPVGSSPSTLTGDTTETLTLASASVLSTVFDKTRRTNFRSVGQTQEYQFLMSNTGNTPLPAYTIVDVIPAQVNVTNIRLGVLQVPSTHAGVTVQYKTNLNGSYRTVPGGPFTMGATAQNLPVGSLGLLGGEYITELRWNLGSLPVGFTSNSATSGASTGFDATVLATDRLGNPVLTGSVVSNTASVTYTGGSASDSTNFDVVDNIPRPRMEKSLVAPLSGTAAPGDFVTYRVRVRNVSTAPGSLTEPVAADLFDAAFVYDSTVSITGNAAAGVIPAPTVQVLNNHNGSGRQLVRWSWAGTGYELPPDGNMDIRVRVRVAAGTPIGSYNNAGYLASFGDTGYLSNDCTTAPRTHLPDSFDLDGDGNTAELICGSETVTISVISQAAAAATKTVQGTLNTAPVMPPATGQTVAGGTVSYSLNVTNQGNVALRNLVLIDLLPRVGDTFVLSATARNSQWTPTMASSVTSPGGATVYYSVQPNPCRPELGYNPAGCAAPVWSTTPPVPLASTQALKFDFGATVIAPGASYSFSWTMNVPAGATVGQSTQNSFGYVAVRNDNGTSLLPSEPTATGVQVSNPVVGFKSVRRSVDADGSGSSSPGDTLVWSLFYANTGSLSINNFQATDVLPSGVTLTAPGAQTITITNGSCTLAPNVAYTGAGVNTLLSGTGTLSSGCTVRIDIPVTINAGTSGTLSNQANATATNLLATGVNSDNIDTATTGLPTGVAAPAGSLTQTQVAAISPTTAAVVLVTGIRGRVFEDVDYGGGAGRACGAVAASPSCSTTATAVGRNAARVELYNNVGAFVATTPTDANGDYGFGSLAAGNYTVRVVNSTVTSSRSGYVAGLLPVQSFRTDASTGTAVIDTNRVAGENPCSSDAGSNTTSATLASLTTGTVGGTSSCATAPATTAQSLAPVTVGSGTVTGVDFGFNFDTIANVKDSGQGSLRQFVLNSNALSNVGLAQVGQTAGREVSIFMVSDGSARPGLRAGLPNQLTAGAAVIPLLTSLPMISGANAINTSIDATTQTSLADTNPGNVGAGGTVGVDGLSLSTVPAPEVAINLSGIASDAADGITIDAAGAVLRGFAIYGKRGAQMQPGSAIYVTSFIAAGGRATLRQLLVGTLASGADPGAALQNMRFGIRVEGVTDISNSFIAYNGYAVLYYLGGASGSTLSNSELAFNGANEAFGSTARSSDGDSVGVWNAANVQITGNLIRDTRRFDLLSTDLGKGIELWYAATTGTLIENNSIVRAQTAGIGIFDGAANNTIRRNVIANTVGNASANTGPGVLLGPTGTVPLRNRISQNSIYNNRGLSIDHDATAWGLGNGVTPNNGTVSATLANNGLDYPVFSAANLSGSSLTTSGFVGSAAGQAAFANLTVELFKADDDGNNNGQVISGDGLSRAHGEGRSYLGSCATGAVNGNFSCTLTVAGLAVGDAITATATDALGNTSEFSANFVVTGSVTGVAVSGSVYADVNHNASLDGLETGNGLVLYVKLVPQVAGTCTGPATAAATVNTLTGAYSLASVSAGNYCLMLDNNNTLADITPTAPANWLRTETPSGARTLTVSTSAVLGQNFGLFNGSMLTGRVFRDTGVGGGTANDNLQNGSEPGIANVAVRATDGAGATTWDSTLTDGSGNYTLWIPAAAGSNPVRVVESNPPTHLSTGGQPGNSGGSHFRSTDTTTFVNAVGASYTGVNFADVPDNAFLTDGVQSGMPGTTLSYTHAFTAGSGGSVSFAISAIASPATAGWSEVLYRDSNCNGVLDGSEGASALTGPLSVSAGEQVCLVMRQFIPAIASPGATNQVTLTANFSYTNASPALASSHTRSDTTTVGTSTSSGLSLNKAVDKATALPGETITYTITYTNNSSGPLSNLRITDSTPTFTRFVSAVCLGPLPVGISACAVDSAPGVGSTGAIGWTLTGSLAPGATGTVSFQVLVSP